MITKNNKIHVYHHGDLDGVFSAILYGKLMMDNGFTRIRWSFESVNYHLTQWQKTNLRTHHPDTLIAVLDFLYNPTCDVWYDHHQSGLGEYTLDQITTQGAYDPQAPSNCSVIFSQEGRSNFRDEELIRKIVDEVSMIDYALYPSISDVYDRQTFGPVIRMALLEQGDDYFMNELIRMCIYDDTSLYKLVEGHLPWSVLWRYNKYKSKLEEGYEAFKKVVKKRGNVIYYITPPYVKTDRYFGFRYDAECDFVVYIQDFRWKGEGYHIGFSKNPWKTKKLVNLKELAEVYGGGGHQDVAGITLAVDVDPLPYMEEIITKLEGSE